MKLLHAITVLALTGSAFAARAQTTASFGFEYHPVAKVVQGTDTLRNAWAGGLDAPQFSNIDLNGDGNQDLFVFDRSNHRVFTFPERGPRHRPRLAVCPRLRSPVSG